MNQHLREVLAGLQGEDLTAAYEMLRTRYLEQRAVQRERCMSSGPFYFVIITRDNRGDASRPVMAKVSTTPAGIGRWLRSNDTIISRGLLDKWPSVSALRGLVDDIFHKLNPQWRRGTTTEQFLDDVNGTEFSIKSA